MDLSVIVPVYNEEESVEPLMREVISVVQPLGKNYELIIVDDGSTDRTYPVLSNLNKQDPRIKVLCLKRNFGQTAALAAGIAYAKGDIIVFMDGDGQNDPRDIPMLVDEIREGFDLVSGWRYPRQDPFWRRRLPSQIANRLISWITRIKLHDYGCTLKAIRSDLAKDLKLYGEMHRFIPAIAYERGARISEIKVHHRPRQSGRSNYGLARTFRVILDLLTVKFLLSYSTRPLHIFGLIGLCSGGIGFLLALYLTVQKILYGADIGGRPLLLLAVLLILIGFQFITMGLLGEMLARTYHESQNKPIYVIKEILDEGKVV
ncbi:MAG: glycosyltransferase family 2 protein [Candidatus Binatia bacterium]